MKWEESLLVDSVLIPEHSLGTNQTQKIWLWCFQSEVSTNPSSAQPFPCILLSCAVFYMQIKRDIKLIEKMLPVKWFVDVIVKLLKKNSGIPLASNFTSKLILTQCIHNALLTACVMSECLPWQGCKYRYKNRAKTLVTTSLVSDSFLTKCLDCFCTAYACSIYLKWT